MGVDMLRIKDRKTGYVKDLFLIDAHHHIGEELDGKKNIPIGKNGSYEFSKKLKEEIKDSLSSKEHRYSVIPDPNGNEISQGLFDQFVVFPMKDHFREEGEYTYTKSNENVSEWTNSSDHRKRLIGFGRVDPTDIKTARKEVKKFSTKYGFFGLKVHPESEKVSLDSKEIVQLYMDCARLNMPIIFHTDYPSDVKEIHAGVNKTICILAENKLKECISQLNVIIGHFDYIDQESFRYLTHPSIYAELSGLQSTKEFIETAKKEVCLSKFTNETIQSFNAEIRATLKAHFWELFDVSTSWSSKIMMGTDHPFFPSENIVNFFEDILNTEVSHDLRLSDIQRILGKNLIDLLEVNCRIHPSVVIDDSESKETKYYRKKDQIEYLIERIIDIDENVPIDCLNDAINHEVKDTDKKNKNMLENLNKTIVKSRKALILAKMLDEKKQNYLDKKSIDEIYEYCEKGQYQKGIKKIKKV